jgi:hypothetical protein
MDLLEDSGVSEENIAFGLKVEAVCSYETSVPTSTYGFIAQGTNMGSKEYK